MKEKKEKKSIICPGYYLGKELKGRGLSQKNFAEQLGIQASHLSEIIKGKRSINDQLAQKLEVSLGIPAEYWIGLQAEFGYNKKMADLENQVEREAIDTLEEYNKVYDMRTIFKYIGFSDRSSCEKLELCEKKLHFVSPSVQQRGLHGLYHRSEKTGLDTRMIATWSVLAKYEAAQCPKPIGDFTRDKMDELARKLREVFNDNQNTLNRVKATLSEYGIKFCVVPKVEKASIDGFSFFLGQTPCIVVTMRYNRIDNLAFAVLHEVGHLKMHSTEDSEGRINLAYSNEELITKEEEEANNFAANSLISEAVWMKAPDVPLIPAIIQQRYTNWAKKNNINKWIVLGRVSHITGVYTFKSDKSREIN